MPQSGRLKPPTSPKPGGVTAKLASMDQAGLALEFVTARAARPPSRSNRKGGATWKEAGVAQASPQPLEYSHTNPNVRIYYCLIDAYNRGGRSKDIEGELAILDELKNRVEGKRRAHKCLWTQGKQRFKCILEDYDVNIDYVSTSGGAMMAQQVTITLKQIP